MFQSIRSRFMFSFSIVTLACVFITSIVGGAYYSNALQEQTFDNTIQILKQVHQSVDSYLSTVANTLSILSEEPALIEYMALGANVAQKYRIDAESKLRKVLDVYNENLSQTTGILITCENGRYVSNSFYRATKDPLHKELWYQSAIATDYAYQLLTAPIGRNLRHWKEYSNNDIVMLNRPVYHKESGKLLGVISVDLRLKDISQLLEELDSGEKGSVFLLDNNGEIVYSPSNPFVYRIKESWFDTNEVNGRFVRSVAGEKLNFLFSTSPQNGWKTVVLFLHNYKTPEQSKLDFMTYLIAAIALFISLVMSFALTRSLSKPIIKLKRLMKQAEDGDLTVHYESQNSSDIDMLGNSFNTMINKIDELLILVVSEQQAKRAAEMNALQAQINPHFLYNTLETIHYMANEHNASEISDTVSALTKLFRISLSEGREFITLAEEIEHVKSYLYIQKIRYEDQLNYSFEIDESLLSSLFLKLSIQPIVENAIYHGIKLKRSSGTVTIKVEREKDDIMISVIDDGVGIKNELLSKIKKELRERERESGFGMYNVNERMIMHFGERYVLRIDSEYGIGSVCIIKHPIIDQKA